MRPHCRDVLLAPAPAAVLRVPRAVLFHFFAVLWCAVLCCSEHEESEQGDHHQPKACCVIS